MINVAQGYISSSNSYNSSLNNSNSQNQSNYYGNRGVFNRGGGYSCGSNDFGLGRGRHGGSRGRRCYANFQCQVYFKLGYITVVCHFCYDSNFQPNASLTLMEPVFQRNSSITFGLELNQGTNSHKDFQLVQCWLIMKIKILTLLPGYLILVLLVHPST